MRVRLVHGGARVHIGLHVEALAPKQVGPISSGRFGGGWMCGESGPFVDYEHVDVGVVRRGRHLIHIVDFVLPG